MKTRRLFLAVFVFFLLVNFALGAEGFRYYPNPTAPDQGATSAQSVKALIDTIGTTNLATLVLTNSKKGGTTYTWSTTDEITSNITVIVEPGATLAIATGVTLTISGPFVSEAAQCISLTGTGKVTGIKEVKPEWWGADPTGTTDSSLALQQAHLSLYSNGGGVLNLTPYATYKIDTISTQSTLVLYGNNIIVKGNNATIKKYNSTGGYWGDVISITGLKNGLTYPITGVYGGANTITDNITIENLNIDNDATVTGDANSLGLVYSSNVTLKKIHAKNSPQTSFAIVADSSSYPVSQVFLDGCISTGSKKHAYRVSLQNTGDTLGVKMRNCQSLSSAGTDTSAEITGRNVHLWYRAGTAAYSSNVYLHVENCYFDSTAEIVTTSGNNGLVLNNNTIEGGGNIAGSATVAHNPKITNNRFFATTKLPVKTHPLYIYNTYGLELSDNYFDKSIAAGYGAVPWILMYSAVDTQIKGNKNFSLQISQNVVANSNIKIENNTFDSNGNTTEANRVLSVASASDTVVDNNTFLVGNMHFNSVTTGIKFTNNILYLNTNTGANLIYGTSGTITGAVISGNKAVLGAAVSTSRIWHADNTNNLISNNLITYSDGSKRRDAGYKFFVSSGAADQGVSSAGSVKEIIDAIGTTNLATLVFASASTTAATTYTFSTDETITSNISVEVEPGATIAVATGKTVTINTLGTVPNQKWIDLTGTGKVVIASNMIARATNYQWWGDATPQNVTLNVTSDFATITAALDHIQNLWIPKGATITISVAAGTHAVASAITVVHPCGKQIKIEGATPVSTTITSVGAVTGSTGNWSVPITVSSAAGISIGQYAIVKNTTGTGDFYTLAGVWEIINVAGSVVTVKNTSRKTVFPTFTGTGGDFVVPPTILSCTGGGIYVYDNPIGELKNLIIKGGVVSSGIYAGGSGAQITVGDNVGVSGFFWGIHAEEAGSIFANYLYASNATSHGLMAQKSGSIDSETQTISTGNTSDGIATNTSSSIIAFGAVTAGNGVDGIWAAAGSIVYTYVSGKVAAKSYSNVGIGAYAESLGTIKFESGTAETNTSFGVMAQNGGMVNITSSTATSNSSGFVAADGGILKGTSPTASGHTSGYGLWAYNGGIAVLSGTPSLTGNATGILADWHSTVVAPFSTLTGNSAYGTQAKRGSFINASNSTMGTNTVADFGIWPESYIDTTSVLGASATPILRHPPTVIQLSPPDWGTGDVTLTIANLLKGVNVGTPGAGGKTHTLPTGTLTDAGVTFAIGESFDWNLINLSDSNAITVSAGEDHTLVGSGTIAAGLSAGFRTRKTAANTFITYRLQ